MVGVEIWGAYDGVLFWECPVCGAVYHRFPRVHWLRENADRAAERGDMTVREFQGEPWIA